MKLIFRGHEDRYAVEQSLLAFFPEERPVYEPAEDGEDHALVTLSRSPRYNTAVTTITYHGRTARGISRTAVDPQLAEYEAERLRQKAVKLSFFKAAREITGITPSWGALTGIRPGKLASRMLEEGMTERQVDRVLRDTYFVSPERRRLCIETAEASRRAKADLRPEDISLYVGIPFCPTRCAYCSFVSQSVERTLGLVEPYLEVLHREITDAARMVQEAGLHIKSFYMGGRHPYHPLRRSDGPAADPPEPQLRSVGLCGILHRGRAAGHHRPGEAAGAAGSRRRPHQRQSPVTGGSRPHRHWPPPYGP